MVIQTEIKTTRTIGTIRGMLDDLASNPDEYDTFKMACEIHGMCRKEEEYKELGRIQAHQEYELAKGGGHG